MRRRLPNYLPVFLIALMVQVLAPIAACWTAAVAASEPGSLAQICRGGAAATTEQGNPGEQQRDRCNACPICCLADGGGSVDIARIDAFSAVHREPASIVWCNQVPAARSTRDGSNGQARAPPTIS